MQKNLLVVLDSVSKQYVKMDDSVINASSITIVSSFVEIGQDVLEKSPTVVMLEGILQCPELFFWLRMYKWQYGLDVVFLCSGKEYPALEEYGRIYACDLRVLDFEIIQAAVFQDSAVQSESSSVFHDSLGFAQGVKDGDYPFEVVTLANDYVCALSREQELARKNRKLADELRDLEAVRAALQMENERWMTGCTELIKRTRQLNDMLERYERTFSRDVYVKLRLQDFQNRPTIVYLKQFNDFLSMDLLVGTLVDVFRIQKRMSAKVLCLLDSDNGHKAKLLPAYYTVLRNKYAMDTVMQADYLCKTGDYLNLLEWLLVNKYGLDVLIIVDMKDYSDVVLDGSFLQYNLCREKYHAVRLGLPKDYTILNESAEGWLCWKKLDLREYTKGEAFLKLSSSEVVQKVVKLSSMFTNAF